MKIFKEKNCKLNAYSLLKLIVLLTPVFISLTLLVAVFHNCFPNGITSKIPVLYIISDTTQINIGLAILGVAVTVWVGLNIYQVIEKKEVDEVKALYNDLLITVNVQKEKLELNDLHIIWYDVYTLSLQFFETHNIYSDNDELSLTLSSNEIFKTFEQELVSRAESIISAFRNKEEKLKKDDVGWYFKQIEILTLFLNNSITHRTLDYKQEELTPIIYSLLKEINRILNKSNDILKNDFKILKECKSLFEIYENNYKMLDNIQNKYTDIFDNSLFLKDMIIQSCNRMEQFKDIKRD